MLDYPDYPTFSQDHSLKLVGCLIAHYRATRLPKQCEDVFPMEVLKQPNPRSFISLLELSYRKYWEELFVTEVYEVIGPLAITASILDFIRKAN